jgi:hypothetical protein
MLLAGVNSPDMLLCADSSFYSVKGFDLDSTVAKHTSDRSVWVF